VADAFARVLRAIRSGSGPAEEFRPYLLTAVRRTVWRRAEQASAAGSVATCTEQAELLDLRLAIDPEDHSEDAIVLEAFQHLPERWQLVLWHTEVEGLSPAEAAPHLGLSPNATAALAVRARRGLRRAYLEAHLPARPAAACRSTVEHLGAYVSGDLAPRFLPSVESHLTGCIRCQELHDDLESEQAVIRQGTRRRVRPATRVA
jgi:DNA-directed RNA polymerase specialized sigma24 family protein